MPYDSQANISYYFAAIEWRMNIQNNQNKPHRKQTSIAQEFTVYSSKYYPVYNILQIGRI